MENNKQHINISIHGMVQGVGFRFFAKNQARILGIKGFVKNMRDGTVYIEAEGNPVQLNEYIKACKKGPSSARVTNVETIEDKVKNFVHFDVSF